MTRAQLGTAIGSVLIHVIWNVKECQMVAASIVAEEPAEVEKARIHSIRNQVLGVRHVATVCCICKWCQQLKEIK